MEDRLNLEDLKMSTYPLMDSVTPTVMLSLLYLIFVLYIGPTLMKNRKPFVLKTPMIIYNLLLVIISSWMVYVFVVFGFSNFNWRCEPVDLTNSEKTRMLHQVSWLFYASKILEFLDTVFFVLRKKDNQINFLHVFHHGSMPVTSWYAVRYAPGGYNMIAPATNAFVHTWMYLYYALAAFGPRVQKYLWWKKYITKMQLLQFALIGCHCGQLLLFPQEGCDIDPFVVKLNLAQSILYMGLFLNFYLKKYTKTEKHPTNGCTGLNNNVEKAKSK